MATTLTPYPVLSNFMPGESPKCNLCDSEKVQDLGIVYHSKPTQVAGIPIDLGDAPINLYACKTCRFQFKFPSIPEEKLLACYASAKVDHWGEVVDPWKRNFDRLAKAIRENAGGNRIIDIGCFNGAFLEYLGSDWDRYGVEPCVSAAKLAESRGIRVIADTINQLTPGHKFDVIAAFDVIEHLVDPKSFFEKARMHLSPNGIFIVSSGDTQSLSWRLQKARYWYCSYLPEHLSFFCEGTLNELGREMGLVSIFHEHMSHKRTPLNEKMKQNLNGLTYSVLLKMGWLGSRKLKSKFATRAGTAWHSATDHFIHVFRTQS